MEPSRIRRPMLILVTHEGVEGLGVERFEKGRGGQV